MENTLETISYLTLDAVTETVAEFTWPAAYELEDDLPDGIYMSFPNSGLYFSEDYLGNVYCSFLEEHTGIETDLQLLDALEALFPQAERTADPFTPGLILDTTVEATPEKVRNGIRDLCNIAVTHLGDVLLGDYGWVEKYRNQ